MRKEVGEIFEKPSKRVFTELRYKTGRELMQSRPVQDVVNYALNWDDLIANREPSVTREQKGLVVDPKTQIIALPYPFVTPSNTRTSPEAAWGEQQFYWDTYFNNRGLLISAMLTGRSDYIDLAKGQIENFQYLFDNLGVIPNGASIPLSNRSQLPLLTSMLFDIYQVEGNREWLEEKMAFAKEEYHKVWMMTPSEAKRDGYRRQPHRLDDSTLATTYVGSDIKKDPYSATAESGRDDSAVWARRAYSIQSVDLHAALYKYETDFAKAAAVAGDTHEQAVWEERAQARRQYVQENFWDEKRGWFFNRDEARGKKDGAYWDVMAYMTMWSGLATPEQGAKMVKHLPKFETEHGLLMSSKKSLLNKVERKIATLPFLLSKRLRRYGPTVEDMIEDQQWDNPYMWTPAMWFAEEGLDNYGYYNESTRIREKSLRSDAAYYADTGRLPEKRNAFTGMNGKGKHYAEQEGFGLAKGEVANSYMEMRKSQEGVRLPVLQYLHESRISYASTVS